MIRAKGFPAPESTSVDLNKNVYAYIKDPDGYTFKLIQRANMRERLWQVSYNVVDIDVAVLFYQDVKLFSPHKSFTTLAPTIRSISLASECDRRA